MYPDLVSSPSLCRIDDSGAAAKLAQIKKELIAEKAKSTQLSSQVATLTAAVANEKAATQLAVAHAVNKEKLAATQSQVTDWMKAVEYGCNLAKGKVGGSPMPSFCGSSSKDGTPH